jgi:hypothetical protein
MIIIVSFILFWGSGDTHAYQQGWATSTLPKYPINKLVLYYSSPWFAMQLLVMLLLLLINPNTMLRRDGGV